MIAIAAAAPAAAASTDPPVPNNALVTGVWNPTSTTPGYQSTDIYGDPQFTGSAGLVWETHPEAPWVTFRNDGPAPLPAGTILGFQYSNLAFDPPTIRTSGSVPGGVSAPTYTLLSSGQETIMEVATLVDIPPGTSFWLDYRTVTRANTDPTNSDLKYRFYGHISPPPSFNDSIVQDNWSQNSADFTRTTL